LNRRSALWLAGFAIATALVAVAAALRADVAVRVLASLTYARPLSPASPPGVVYVLGGTPESLQAKFVVAAGLLKDGRATRVLVLNQRGAMEFSPVLGRNLSANEWALARLGELGVPADAIGLVDVEQGFFGTWSEARSLPPFVRQRGYRTLILVTSAYHSRRAWESFAASSERFREDLYVHLSDEPVHLRDLVPEYLKLQLYRILLF
jgi:uncharacterized SAM-binding protein YcdF (DUF218 family)